MLGFGAISSRGISGSPYSLISVPVSLAASASFLTFAGSADTGLYIPMTASAAAITFSGSAPGVWLQAISSAPVTALTFGGSPRLLLAGKPFVFRMISQPTTFRATRDRTSFKMIARPYTFRGYR
jgi:hypothetical protein